MAWNSARYNQQQAGLPLADLVRGDTLQRASLYLAASPRFPAAEATRWRKIIATMRDDGSLARIIKQYDYQAPDKLVRIIAKAVQNGYGIPMKALIILSSQLTPR